MTPSLKFALGSSRPPRKFSHLRQHRNALVPINRLPTELLTRIFLESLLVAADPEWKYYHVLRSLRLVSTRWAIIIDAAPSFWTSVYCHDSRNEVTMSLAKSRGCPLNVGFLCRDNLMVEAGWDVGLTDPDHDHSEFYGAIIKESQKWRSLKFRSGGGWVEPTEGVFGVKMPNLTSLDASFQYSYDLTEPLFGDWAPKLENAILRRVSVPWGSRPLMNLRSLSLQKITTPGPSANDLTVIMASPILETFEIVDCDISPSETPRIAPADRPVTLPFLTAMSMSRLSYVAAVALQPLLEYQVAPKLGAFTLDLTVPPERLRTSDPYPRAG